MAHSYIQITGCYSHQMLNKCAKQFTNTICKKNISFKQDTNIHECTISFGGMENFNAMLLYTACPPCFEPTRRWLKERTHKFVGFGGGVEEGGRYYSLSCLICALPIYSTQVLWSHSAIQENKLLFLHHSCWQRVLNFLFLKEHTQSSTCREILGKLRTNHKIRKKN